MKRSGFSPFLLLWVATAGIVVSFFIYLFLSGSSWAGIVDEFQYITVARTVVGEQHILTGSIATPSACHSLLVDTIERGAIMDIYFTFKESEKVCTTNGIGVEPFEVSFIGSDVTVVRGFIEGVPRRLRFFDS